jgi:hypothetical protein
LAHDGKSHFFTGTVGVFEFNQLGADSKPSNQKLEFQIEFLARNRQRVLGYVHIRTPTRLSGLTWRYGQPYGWTAEKIL